MASLQDWVGVSLSGGRYQVTSRLGEGGMGFVYRAIDRNLDTDVVIKVPRRALLDDPEFSSRFGREIRSLVALAHPHIVKVTDVGDYDGLPFAVMQYLPGGSLDDQRQSASDGSMIPVSPSTLADWLPHVAEALDFVHQEGFVHRDVKPGNILFDRHGHAFLSDFGVAKVVASGMEQQGSRSSGSRTGTGVVLGTPEYMAPELILGLPFDGRIDQYALAVTVYEMLCGRRPFEASTPTAVLVQQSTLEPPAPDSLRPDLGRAISQTLLRALSKEPSARFPSNIEFARSVLKAAAAPPPSGPMKLRLPCPKCQKALTFSVPSPEAVQTLIGRRTPCPACAAVVMLAGDPRSPRLALTNSVGGTLAISAPIEAIRTPSQGLGGSRPSSWTPVKPSGESVPLVEPFEVIETAQPAATPKRTSSGTAIETRPDLSNTAPRTGLSLGTWFGIGAGATSLVAIIALIALNLGRPEGSRRDGPMTGMIEIGLGPTASQARVVLDGVEYNPMRLADPIPLPVGTHRVKVTKPGYELFQRTFEVAEGTNPALVVKLVPIAPVSPVVLLGAQEAGAPISRASGAGSGLGPGGRLAPAPGGASSSALSETGVPALSTANKPPIDPNSPPAAIEPEAELKPLDGGHYALDKDALSFSQVFSAPQDYANRIVTPAGLLVLGTDIHTRPDQFETMAVCDHEGVYENMEISLQNLNLVLEDKLAHTLHRLIQNRTVAPSHPVIAHHRNTADPGYPSVATIKVQKMRWRDKEYWVGMIVRLQICIEMDPMRLGARKFLKAFRAITIDGDHFEDGFADGEEWKDRVGPAFLRPFVSQYKRLQAMNDAQRRAFLSSQYYSVMGAGANMATQSRASQTKSMQDIMRQSSSPR